MFSGFATKNHEQVYDKLVFKLIELMQYQIIQKCAPCKLIRCPKSIVQSCHWRIFRSSRKLSKSRRHLGSSRATGIISPRNR